MSERRLNDMEEPSKEYDYGFIDGTKEGKRQLQQRIKEFEAENKALRRPMESANFEVAGMVAVGNELISRDEQIKELEKALDVAETFLRVHTGTELVLKQIEALKGK